MKLVIDARESGTSTGRYIDKLIEHLHKSPTNFEVIILTKKHRIDFFNKFATKYHVVESPYKEFTFAEQLKLNRQLNKISPDLVHFGMVQQPVLYKGTVITTMHDLTTTRFKNPSKNPLVYAFKQMIYKWVNRVAALKSNAIITPSEFVKDDVAKFAKINSRKISVIYQAADKITDKAEPIEELINIKFIMYVGRPQPHKNLYRLVTAFADLKKKNPELKLVLVGKEDVVYDQLKTWVRGNNIKDVVFTGFISEGSLKWLYENCRAYVFPSLSEGFGLPGLEAMRHGAPVVSSNATCLPEIYGDAAHYFDPNSTEDITAKISEVLKSSSLRTELTRKGHIQANKYSWNKTAEQTLELYKAVLKESSLSTSEPASK